MSASKKLGVVFLTGIIMLFGMELGERFSVPGVPSFIAKAEARVGRPLTPVSVAGVGRRTTRRCVAGVYDC
jgi:hypothetical protein